MWLWLGSYGVIDGFCVQEVLAHKSGIDNPTLERLKQDYVWQLCVHKPPRIQ